MSTAAHRDYIVIGLHVKLFEIDRSLTQLISNARQGSNLHLKLDLAG